MNVKRYFLIWLFHAALMQLTKCKLECEILSFIKSFRFWQFFYKPGWSIWTKEAKSENKSEIFLWDKNTFGTNKTFFLGFLSFHFFYLSFFIFSSFPLVHSSLYPSLNSLISFLHHSPPSLSWFQLFIHSLPMYTDSFFSLPSLALYHTLLLSLFLTPSITLSFPHSLCYSLFPSLPLFPLLTIFFILNISPSLSIPLLPTHFLFIWVSAFVLVLLALTIFSHVLWRIFYAAIKILGHRYPFNLPPIDSLDVNLNFDFCCLNFCSREPLSKRDVGFEPRYIRNQLLRWHIVLFLKCFPIHSTFCMI